MKFSSLAATLRLSCLLLAPAAGLLLTACATKETDTVAVDYSKQDDALIQKYLADNKITTAQKQPSGLYYVPVTTNASGTAAVAGKTVAVLYTGTLLDNTVFDASSKNGNKPIEFVLGAGRVIKGWDEGIALMHKGEKGVLLIPSALGYGAAGAGSAIPPNTVIKFDVEVTDVK